MRVTYALAAMPFALLWMLKEREGSRRLLLVVICDWIRDVLVATGLFVHVAGEVVAEVPQRIAARYKAERQVST